MGRPSANATPIVPANPVDLNIFRESETPRRPSDLSLASMEPADGRAAQPRDNSGQQETTSLADLLKQTEADPEDIIMRNVSAKKKATPRKRSVQEPLPEVPEQKKGGFFSNLFKK